MLLEERVFPLNKDGEVLFPKGMTKEALKVYQNNYSAFKEGKTYADANFTSGEALAHRYANWKLSLYYEKILNGTRIDDWYVKFCRLD